MEDQEVRSRPGPPPLLNQNFWDRSRNQCFNKPSWWFFFMLKFLNDSDRRQITGLGEQWLCKMRAMGRNLSSTFLAYASGEMPFIEIGNTKEKKICYILLFWTFWFQSTWGIPKCKYLVGSWLYGPISIAEKSGLSSKEDSHQYT